MSKEVIMEITDTIWTNSLHFHLFKYIICQHSAQTALEENERIFTELLLSIERKYNDVKEMIRSHEKTTVTRGEILLDRLEEEITLLRKRHTDLEKLSHTDDHIHFLQVRMIWAEDPEYVCLKHPWLDLFFSILFSHQSWQSLSGPSGYEDLNNISVAPYYSFDATKRAIATLKLQVEEVTKIEMTKVSGAGRSHLTSPSSFQVALMYLFIL